MSRKHLYTILVTEYQRLRQWKVELHTAAPDELAGSVVFSARLSMDGELPSFIQARMNMVDMGQDVNAWSRVTEGIGTRYMRSDITLRSGAGEWPGRVTQYFLHDITEEQAKEAGLLQNHKLRGKRADAIIVDDLKYHTGVP